MTLTNHIISAVDRVVEHPEVWTRRLAKSKWGERIPHIERGADGTDAWVVDGRIIPLSDIAQVGAVMPDRAKTPARWDDIDASTHLPGERIKAMDRDSVDYTVLYPSVAGFSGETFGAINDPGLELACAQAYNDWLIEEWTSANSRFIPQCIVPLSPVDATVSEIKRAVAGGHRGVIFPAEPMHLRNLPHINSSAYDPVWATCQELDVPLCFHAGSAAQLQFPMAPNLAPELAAAFQAVIRPASAVFDLSNILFSRMLLRFPQLKVVFAESTIGWGTFLLEYADHQYEQDHCNYELKPSEMFRRQCYLTTWYDPVKINARHIGTDRILWATNFPTTSSTWPESRQFAERCLAGMRAREQEQILRGNAAKLYKIDGKNGTLE
ncbi:MAG TPA: amidohydrolase family protein [Candidatus Binatia bacterium]|jgi:predicted TIM-barrel fold metal-dependent hydrolase|nr:amidohydrolase family protein [Candidatus Binatia bacterium]